MAYAEYRGKDRNGKQRWRGRYLKPDGTWGSVSRDDNKQPFRKKRDAEQYAEGLETDVRRKTFLDPRDGRITVAQWAELWIESVELATSPQVDGVVVGSPPFVVLALVKFMFFSVMPFEERSSAPRALMF